MPHRTDTRLPKPPAASAGECAHAGTSEERVLVWIERLDKNVSVLTAGEAARLVDCLSGEHKPARRRAADALAAAMRAGAVSPQICERELDSTDPARRWGAAFALHRAGHGGSRVVVDAALATLELDDGDMRWAALAIVVPAAREDENIRARLRDLAAAPGALARKMALLCLCDSGEADTAIYLRALGDPDALVRIAALTALGRIRDTAPRTLGALRRTSEHDEAPTVRRAAAAILERLGRHKG